MDIEVTNQHGQTYIGGLNHVFHCNHYNAYLQTAVLLSEGVGRCRPRELLANAMIPLIKYQLAEGIDRKELIDLFAFCGFGKLRPLPNGEWVTPTSHYGQAAIMQGKREESCFFTSGYISGLTDERVEESQCKQQGSSVDWFKPQGELGSYPDYLIKPAHFTDVPPRFQFPDCQTQETPIDEATIIKAVSGLPLFGKSGIDDTGLIDAFGVVLTNHYADYYNYISYETYFGMLNGGMPVESVRDVLVQGGHICAFNTFGGIMSSPEWYQLVAPVCRHEVDWLHGMIAVINALGWGVWRVEQVTPGRELIVRIYNSYEGVGFRRIYPQSQEVQLSFLNLGAVQGLAHLFWKIDIRDRPTLDNEFYNQVFNDSTNSYSVTQTHAIAAGHGYDRIVARRD